MDARKAIALQKKLARRVVLQPLDVKAVRYVAGVDVSFPGGPPWMRRMPSEGAAAAVVYDVFEKRVVETAHARGAAGMAYVPGLLSFREGPIVIEALKKLRHVFDVIMADGQGIAHPRRLGIASHVGLWTGKPAFGCAKSLLVGAVQGRLGEKAGACRRIVHGGEVVGAAYRTRSGVKPVYVSPGHLMDLASVTALMKRLRGKYRLPEPVRAAHFAAGSRRRSSAEQREP